MAGLKAFREEFVTAGLIDEGKFPDFEARKLRYDIYWAFYENTAYRNIHKWATKLKSDFGLYRYIRNIYNPSYRIGEFWKEHVFGGLLDLEAGDGDLIPSAIPIEIPKGNEDNEEVLRLAIAQIWAWSNWQIKKDVFTLYGSVLGDALLFVTDDTDLEEVYIEVAHPAILKEVDLDAKGHVKGYTLEEKRQDPETDIKKDVTYLEVCERDGDDVVYSTFLNKAPYHWEGNPAEEWDVNYGFVPMILTKNNDVGLDWGWSEIHAGRSKFQELDDLASKLSDHIRKSVDPVWFFSGVAKGSDSEVDRKETEPTEDRPAPGRDELPAIYAANPQAKANALVAELDIEQVSKHIGDLLEEIERDYPELQTDIGLAIQTNSSRAIRVARQRSEIKAHQRRAQYDDAMVRAQQMAISIAALNGYEGFDIFDPEKSYWKGDLDHRIAKHPVFTKDPMDDLELGEQFWKNAEQATKAGYPLILFLTDAGWEEDRIAAYMNSEEYKARLQAMENAAMLGESREESDDDESTGESTDEDTPNQQND